MKGRNYKNIWASPNFLLIIILFFHCINSLYWFNKDGYIQHGCHSVWIEKLSLDCSRSLNEVNRPVFKKVLSVFDCFKLSHYGYAFSATNFNLTNLLIMVPISLPVDGTTRLFLINTILFSQFLLVLLAIYFLGKTMFNKAVGAWAAIILSFYPGMLGLSRKTNSELMVTLFVIISALVLIRWRYLPMFLRTLLLFTVFALGTLSGALFLVFFIPLFLTHIFFNLIRSAKKKSAISEIIIFFCLSFLFFNFYFGGQYGKVISNINQGFTEAYRKLTSASVNFVGSANNAVIESFLFAPQDSICPCTQSTNVGINIRTFLFYIMEMIYYVSPVFFVLAVFSLFFLFKDKKVNFFKRIFFGVWIVFSYLLLSLFHIKWGKFSTPILPALALSSGIFICHWSRDKVAKATIVLFFGILTVLYYSYVPLPHERFLEKLNEGIISHRPLGSRFVHVAEKIAKIIDSYNVNKTDSVTDIAFLDKESPRFEGPWVSDISVRVENLIRVFLKKNYRIKDFWRISDDFYETLYRRDCIVLISKQKIKDIDNYLYPLREGKPSNLNLEIIYEDWLFDGVYIYLVKISQLNVAENIV